MRLCPEKIGHYDSYLYFCMNPCARVIVTLKKTAAHNHRSPPALAHDGHHQILAIKLPFLLLAALLIPFLCESLEARLPRNKAVIHTVHRVLHH